LRPTALKRITFATIGLAVACAGLVLATEYDLAKDALLQIKRMVAPAPVAHDPHGLHGLEYLHGVVVEGMGDDMRAAGVPSRAMADVVEARLRDGGLMITGVPTIPFEHLYVRISGVELRTGEGARYGWYSVAVELALRQPVFLERVVDGEAVQAWATTWDTTALVFSPAADLTDDIASELARQSEKLLDEWKRVNADD
jgi:hypothetical protein